jgi:tRNA (guanine37-N1)-methyltransferase
MSGHHKNIEAWKREMSIRTTFRKRRGMLAKASLSQKEKEFVEELKKNENL